MRLRWARELTNTALPVLTPPLPVGFECLINFPGLRWCTAGVYTLVVSAHTPRHLGPFVLNVKATSKIDVVPIQPEGAGMYARPLRGEWCGESFISIPHDWYTHSIGQERRLRRWFPCIPSLWSKPCIRGRASHCSADFVTSFTSSLAPLADTGLSQQRPSAAR